MAEAYNETAQVCRLVNKNDASRPNSRNNCANISICSFFLSFPEVPERVRVMTGRSASYSADFRSNLEDIYIVLFRGFPRHIQMNF
jgi:hypothetical protein